MEHFKPINTLLKSCIDVLKISIPQRIQDETALKEIESVVVLLNSLKEYIDKEHSAMKVTKEETQKVVEDALERCKHAKKELHTESNKFYKWGQILVDKYHDEKNSWNKERRSAAAKAGAARRAANKCAASNEDLRRTIDTLKEKLKDRKDTIKMERASNQELRDKINVLEEKNLNMKKLNKELRQKLSSEIHRMARL